MRHILFFLLSITSLFITAASAEPIPPHVGEFSFTDYLSFYRTAGNYSSNYNYPLGVPANDTTGDLLGGGTMSTLTDTVSVNWDALPEIRFNANLSYDYTTSSSAPTTYNPLGASFNASGVSEFGYGAQYWIRDRHWALVPQISGGVPFYRNNLSQGGALLGNGATWVEGGGYGILYFYPIALYGYLGYRYQDSGLAGLMNMELGGSYRFNRARLRVGVRGETAVSDDRDTSNPALRNALLNSRMAGSFHYYSVNPTLFDAYAEGDWLFNRMIEAGVGFSQSVYGVNSAVGWTVTGMIRIRLPSDAGRSKNLHQDYLKPAIAEPIFEPKGTEGDDIDPTPRGGRKKNIDKMLNDTEKSLDN